MSDTDYDTAPCVLSREHRITQRHPRTECPALGPVSKYAAAPLLDVQHAIREITALLNSEAVDPSKVDDKALETVLAFAKFGAGVQEKASTVETSEVLLDEVIHVGGEVGIPIWAPDDDTNPFIDRPAPRSEPFAIRFPEGEGIDDALRRMVNLAVKAHLTDAEPVTLMLTRVGHDTVSGRLWDEGEQDFAGRIVNLDLDRITMVDYL